jgi:proline dehydrogenase
VLKSILLYLSEADWARRLVTGRRLARRVASRFVAGDKLEDAIIAIRALNEKGLYGTLDQLGENVATREEAMAATDHYFTVFKRMNDHGLKTNASLKLTQMGLHLDFDMCFANVERIIREAARFDTFVRLDMEDAPTIDNTIRIFRILKDKGIDNVGLVTQAYLYRSEEDVATLLTEDCTFRLCKGAYRESADIAHTRMRDINAAFDRLAEMLIDYACANGAVQSEPNGKVPPVASIATHDAERIEHAKQYAHQVGLPKQALEFQMLHGIRSDLQVALAQEGYPVRVYVPFGTEWYPYFFRRLAERPANLWLFLSTFLRG